MSFINAVRQCTVHATKFDCCSTKLNFICPQLWPLAAQSWARLITSRELYSSLNVSCVSILKKSSSHLAELGKVMTQLLSEKMRFACFHVLPGNAEALVQWGGKINHCLSNISAKYYQYQFVFVKVMTRQMWDIFSGHNVLLLLVLLLLLLLQWYSDGDHGWSSKSEPWE